MAKTVSDKFRVAGDALAAAQKKEKGLRRRLEALRAEFGRARTKHVCLELELRVAMSGALDGDGEAIVPQAEVLKRVTTYKAALVDQETLTRVLAKKLEVTEAALNVAAAEVAAAWNVFRTQAYTEFQSSWTRTAATFAGWGDGAERVRAMRFSMLDSLLGQVLSGEPGAMDLLTHLLTGTEFRLAVHRGFRIVTEAGTMRDITPSPHGAVFSVPSDISFNDAFSAVLNQRARLAMPAV